MPDEQTKLILNQMLAHHETNFGPDLWAEARSRPSKWAVDAILRSLITWDDRLQELTHSYEFFTPAEFRNAICERLGCSYADLSDDLPESEPILGTYFRILGVVAILIALLKWCGSG